MSAALAPEVCAPTGLPEALRARLSAAAVVRANEPLARRTTLRVGGPAEIFVEPASEADLAATLAFAREHGQPWFVLGRGSNLLVRDGGVRGLVISLAHAAFARITVAATRLHCGAGAKLRDVALAAKRCALAGLEFLEGIPGSVGGALRMNAGAYGGWMFDRVETLRVMDAEGRIEELPAAAAGAQYRSCPLLRDRIALGAVLRGELADRAAIERRMAECSRQRWSAQPKAPSAGCAFKNPATVPAGRLIDELGLKGTRVGGARVSLEHGNFIVTEADATARDVLALLELIRERARTERGVELETEIQIIGVEP